ncbi:spexin [Morone saxatilis]|uniref:spexin n=1 Tax=Morone saxatilis TaxID=34816 RepID=UPI0015E1C5B8|nr:spexin [Morone saxatilis]
MLASNILLNDIAITALPPVTTRQPGTEWTSPSLIDPHRGYGLRTITLTYVLTLLLLASFISQSWSAPKGSFQRRNWTPQAMLYLKGTQGRRFISEDRKEGDVYDTLHLETRSQNTEKLSVDQAATVLLNFLQQAREGADENPDEVYFQELPVWKREYF